MALVDTLDPSIQPLARELLRRRPDLTITSAFRTLEEQERLYAQGRTSPGAIVTHAKPGFSWHNYGLAFDVAPKDEQGRPFWPDDQAFWDAVGAEGRSIGLRWGGDFGDWPHFEYHPDLSITDAQNGVRPSVPALPQRTKRKRSLLPIALGIGAGIAIAIAAR